VKLDARAEAWLRLSASGVGPRPLAALLRAFGSPEAVAAARPAERKKRVPDADWREQDRSGFRERLDAARAWLLEDPAHAFVPLDDPEYPRALLEIGDPPPVLYCLGRRELFAGPALAIVGSRNATPQGESDARAFAAALSGAGLTIVSGLAQGIDAAAHRGALEGRGSSIAVAGTGLDRVYPAANRELAHDLATRGLVVSEFTPGTPPRKENFPRRNRIVSGLARGVLVIEATLASGSLITARLAGEQGREVFAVPGSIHSPFSKGCHKLLREGAKLVETAQDVLDELGMAARTGPTAPVSASGSRDALTATERAVLAALGHAPAAADVVVARSGLMPEAVAAALVALELAGRVAAVPGGLWQRRD
jgi:DNA processing protein